MNTYADVSIHLHDTRGIEAWPGHNQDGTPYICFKLGSNAAVFINSREQLDAIMAQMEAMKDHMK